MVSRGSDELGKRMIATRRARPSRSRWRAIEPFSCYSHLVGVSKPDPRIFEIALARLGASPEESVYVGDLYGIDVRGARSAGLSAVLIDRWDLQPDADCPRIACLGELERTIDAAI